MSKKIHYPYIIHCCLPSEQGLFPTHTHGLKKIDWPEFIIDPLCFGPNGNGLAINYSFDFFRKPINKHKLEEILNGDIVRLGYDLIFVGSDSPGMLCYRLVSNSFAAVQMAYETDSTFNLENDRVVQIWVDGDDFALTDEYYISGDW